MKIEMVTQPRENGADIHLGFDRDGESWITLRWTQDQNRLVGFHGFPASGGLAQVRPVVFAGEDLGADNVGAYAAWIALQACGFEVAREGASLSSGRSGIVSEWEAFLGGGRNVPASQKEDDRHVVLSEGTLSFLKGHGLLVMRRDFYVPGKRDLIKIGRPVSGFQAIKIQKSVSENLEQVPAPPSLDIDAAKKALFAVENPGTHAVVWYGSATGEVAVARLQAATSVPVLAGMMADNPRIARAIDTRESLQPILIERTGLAKAGLKRLSKVTVGLPSGNLFEGREQLHGQDALGVDRRRRFMVSGNIDLDTALRHLAAMPPDRVPQDDASWMAYHDILSGCAIPIENALGIPVSEVLSASKGNWLQFRESLARAADFEPEDFSRRTMALCTIDALEAIEDFARSAVLPVALHSIRGTGEAPADPTGEFFQTAFDVAAEVFVGQARNPAVHLLEAARRYASRIPALMDATGFLDTEVKPSEDLRWQKYGVESFPLLSGNFEARNGLVIRPLPNFEAMRRESQRLGHCVGRMYLSKARKGHCHIYSVQSRDSSKSFSTIEISGVDKNGTREALAGLRLIQHRAKNNRDPSPDCKVAFSEWFSALKKGDIQINLDEVRAWQEHVRNSDPERAVDVRPSWSGALGMDWQDEQRCRAVWEEWRFILGGAFGKSETPDVIYRLKSARDLVGEMSPKAAAILLERARLQKEERVDLDP